MDLEAEQERKRVFEEQYKKDVRDVAIRNAQKQAAEMSGLQKLRAVNRARRLQEGDPEQPNFFRKFSEYTQKNLAKREANLQRTKEMRETAQKMKEERLIKQQEAREDRIGRTQARKPFGRTSWH